MTWNRVALNGVIGLVLLMASEVFAEKLGTQIHSIAIGAALYFLVARSFAPMVFTLVFQLLNHFQFPDTPGAPAIALRKYFIVEN